MNVQFSEMKIVDYAEVTKLWLRTKGVVMSANDNRTSFRRFLKRNPGMSFVARVDGAIVGTVLCGYDGFRGYIYHFAVDENFRKRGIGRSLVERALSKLEQLDIDECRLTVTVGNDDGLSFWKGLGWKERDTSILLEQAGITLRHAKCEAA